MGWEALGAVKADAPAEENARAVGQEWVGRSGSTLMEAGDKGVEWGVFEGETWKLKK